MQRIAIGLIGLLLVSQAQSALNTVNTSKIAPETLRNVLEVAGKYNNAISCNSEEVHDVIEMEPVDSEAPDEGLFYVIWMGDIECSRGSGSMDFHVTTVRGSLYPRVVVNESNPVVSFIADQQIVIEKISKAGPDTLLIEGLQSQENDASCCPTKKIKKILKRDQQGNWHAQR